MKVNSSGQSLLLLSPNFQKKVFPSVVHHECLVNVVRALSHLVTQRLRGPVARSRPKAKSTGLKTRHYSFQGSCLPHLRR